MAKDAIYEGTRDVRTFVDLAHGAEIIIMKTEQEPQGSYYTTMSALLLTAFTFEAYLKHLGKKTICRPHFESTLGGVLHIGER